ncbi:FkbM family methyltransferase [Laspinema sp. D1]|uniref:FkbM family methyltransferase n=1 Tax=Laspinema palackyanum D2a TaxID=2953684 RepID=A0ABT2MUV5_9CYAN|nr:FkbM family methyltransferase [Laspinema sp. D2a]
MNKPHEFFRPDLDAEDLDACSKAIKRDLLRILEPNSIVLDVGANRGQFALEVIEVFPEVKIFSFEPVPEAFNDLKLLGSTYQQITPINQAISSQVGSATFYVMESDVGSSLLEPIANQPSKWLTLNKKVTVDTTRLDTFVLQQKLDTLGTPIKLLKTDAQGADLDVIKSAGKFLNPNSIETILVEVNFKNFYDNQQSFHEILAELDKNGYRLAWLYPHRAHDEWLWWADALFISK